MDKLKKFARWTLIDIAYPHNLPMCTKVFIEQCQSFTFIAHRPQDKNPSTENPDLSRPHGRKLLKTLLEKEKTLIISIFSFSHNVVATPSPKVWFYYLPNDNNF